LKEGVRILIKMLHLILGKNKEKFENALKMDAFNWDADLVRGKIESRSLFAGPEVSEMLVLDNISENAEAWGVLKEIAEVVVKSEGKVVMLESDLKKEEVEFFEELRAKVEDLREKKGIEYNFSPFALQDAVGERNAKHAWIEYIKLANSGIEAEEIAPKVINKMRDMISINKGASKEDLGIKSDFPYNKSKRDLKNWKIEAAEKFYTKLISIYHEARSSGGIELSIALEKELLKI